MSAAKVLLSVRGLKASYGNIVALKGVDIDIREGEIVTLIGANGAGKSTLMMTIFGNPRAREGEIVTLIGANGAGKSTLMMTIFGNPRAREGRIVFDGRDIMHLPTQAIARLGLALAPEGRRIFPRMTVYENLQMGAAMNNGAHFACDLERIFSIFPRLQERADQRGGTRSGGEQQMLAIGRALMSRPCLLMLDEPSLGLAPLIVKQILGVICDLNRQQGLTVFLVEQNPYHAMKLAGRGYVMANGLISLSGTGGGLLANPEIRADYFGSGR